ncbi:IS21 family transposase [Aromatoleum evansii]|uniref:IS21 family transposase n=1 Tax=Aromatoleum evansii TaxID=59406 RepID=A0ABZ1AKS0_AROEV|nr:IS21 family transposase [Aromatoleum evansii]
MEREAVMSGVDAVQGPRALDRIGVTVSGLKPGTEGDVIGREQWNAIHVRRREGASVSAIAGEFDLDRKTVRGCLRQDAWRPYLREKSAATVLDAHRAWLAERAPQVRYSARILYQELRGERGFAGSYETVKLAVRPLRAQASLAALTQCRFETAPGEQAQVDWGQITVGFADQRTKVHVFVMTLGYSRRAYAEGFVHERMCDLLAAHEHAFAHFGGRCECLLYDRMRTVVLGTEHDGDGERRPRLNATFAAFADHWGFIPRLCQPYRAQTKGKVESGVKYVKRNFVPGRTFADLDDFNQQLACWQAEVADRRIHGTTHQRPIERFADEASALVPTAGQASFLQAMVRSRVVADDWLVSIDGNRYSVPFGLIGQTVEVVRAGGNWLIRHRGRLVAEHPVLAGRAQLSVCPQHGPGAAMRNARQRHAGPPSASTPAAPLGRAADALAVEVRDLAIYEHLLEAGVLGRGVQEVAR